MAYTGRLRPKEVPVLGLRYMKGYVFYVSGKLPTYLSPKPTLTLTSHLGQNVGLGGGVGGQVRRSV